MADYRKMTLESLRELARKALGPGHSRRTKPELIALLEGAGAPAPRASAAAPRTGARSAPSSRAAAKARAPKAAAPKPAGKAPAKAAGKGAKAARAGAAPGRKAPARAARAAEAPADDGTPGAEGYFVARVRGEDAVREAPHPLTETAADAPGPWREEPQPQRPDEGLGELPWSYGDDAFVALPRDPRTLFVYWDFGAGTTRDAFAGLEGGKAELRLFARAGTGWELVRTVGFALESRGYYLHDLDPGRIYRVEIHAVGRDGTDRAIGAGSNEMMLPTLGPSPIIDDRFIRIPWDMPLGRLLGPGHAGGPFSDEARALLARLSDWSRFGGGGGSIGGIGVAGGSVGRGPGASPSGAWGSGSGSGSGRG